MCQPTETLIIHNFSKPCWHSYFCAIYLKAIFLHALIFLVLLLSMHLNLGAVFNNNEDYNMNNATNQLPQDNQDIYLTPKMIPAHFPAFTESSIRFLIFSNKNNFNQYIKRVGRKILISKSKFHNWIENQNA